MAVVKYDVGRILCRHVRGYLDTQKFLGRDIDWLESDGWLSHTFTIKGDDADVVTISAYLDYIAG